MNPNSARIQSAIPCFLFLVAASPGLAAFSWPGCPEASEKDFKYQSVIGRSSAVSPKVVDATMEEPIHMAFDLLADNTTDVYWVERHGGLKRYIAAKNQVAKLGALEIVTADRDEQGLTGIALDPGFKTNHWLYVFWAPLAENNVFRLSRFSLNPEHTALDKASEKVLLTIKSQRQYCCHTAGAMSFDLHGDLWVAVGKNSPDNPNSIDETNINKSSEATSANAADMRGGIVRIHPDNSAKGYSIPAGNYGEYWSKYFKAKGNDAVAAEYANPAKVLPEIYVKGTRNPYSLTVDPVRQWVAWGEFGPNMDATMTEEHNLVTHPVFGGYPYFAGGGGTGGSGCAYLGGMCELWRGTTTSAGDKDMTAPMNNSKWNGGPRLLPPVEPALHTYPRSGAITGPIYRYNGGSPSTIKFPPHFENSWFVGDMRKQWLKIYKLNDTGTKLTDSLTWFTNYNFADILDIQQGPDGAIYILNYAGNRSSSAQTSIGRIEYTGTCRPSVRLADVRVASHPAPGIRIGNDEIAIEANGAYGLRIHDHRGKVLRSLTAAGEGTFGFSALGVSRPGIYFVTVEGSFGLLTRVITRL